MVDPDAPDLAAAVPIRCIQENERVPLSIDAEFEHPLGGRELGTEAEVQALVVSGNYAGRGHVLPLDQHDPAQRIVGDRPPWDALEFGRRHHGPVLVEGGQLAAGVHGVVVAHHDSLKLPDDCLAQRDLGAPIRSAFRA